MNAGLCPCPLTPALLIQAAPFSQGESYLISDHFLKRYELNGSLKGGIFWSWGGEDVMQGDKSTLGHPYDDQGEVSVPRKRARKGQVGFHG